MTLTLKTNEVHLWYMDLSFPSHIRSFLYRLLTVQEQARSDRYKSQELSDRFIAARAGMRWILSQYLGGSPQAIDVKYNPYGKPYLKTGAPIYFNLSHSGKNALLGIARWPIGVDIENINHKLPALDLAKRFFAASEFESLQSSETPLESFYRLWTCKEAVLKAEGVGITKHLSQLCLKYNNNRMHITAKPSTIGHWEVYWWLRDACHCALASSYEISDWGQYQLELAEISE